MEPPCGQRTHEVDDADLVPVVMTNTGADACFNARHHIRRDRGHDNIGLRLNDHGIDGSEAVYAASEAHWISWGKIQLTGRPGCVPNRRIGSLRSWRSITCNVKPSKTNHRTALSGPGR